jgi:hypothetical protein
VSTPTHPFRTLNFRAKLKIETMPLVRLTEASHAHPVPAGNYHVHNDYLGW